MANWEEFDEQLGALNKEFSRHQTEIRESFYSTKRAITAVFETALQSTAKAIETVHPLYENFHDLGATPKESLHEVVRAFEKLDECTEEQIQLVKTRKPELEKLSNELVYPMLRGIEDRKRKLENDRWLLRRDPSDSEPAREVATFKARIQELDDEIKRLTAAHDDLSRQNPLILVHLLPKIQALKTQIEQKRDEQYKTRTKLFEAEAKARANLEDKLKAFEELADDLQIQTERSAAYGPLVEEMRKDVEKCAEELEQLKYDRIYKFIQEAKEITGSAIGASRPPADRDALAVQLANLTVRSLTFFDKNVNGYLVNDGELVVSKLGMVYGNGQVRMPDSVKSAFDSLKSTLAGMVQEADETGGYEEIPEWYTERRGKLVRGELKEW